MFSPGVPMHIDTGSRSRVGPAALTKHAKPARPVSFERLAFEVGRGMISAHIAGVWQQIAGGDPDELRDALHDLERNALVSCESKIPAGMIRLLVVYG